MMRLNVVLGRRAVPERLAWAATTPFPPCWEGHVDCAFSVKHRFFAGEDRRDEGSGQRPLGTERRFRPAPGIATLGIDRAGRSEMRADEPSGQ
jgi:hypothetical protein